MPDHTYTYNPARPYCAQCYGTGSVRHTDDHGSDAFSPCNCRTKEGPVNHADYELRRVRAQRDELLAALAPHNRKKGPKHPMDFAGMMLR